MGFLVFHTPILAATTHAAAIKARFIAECNKHAGVLQKIAPKNIFSMAIHTRLGKANRPGRGRSGLVQSQFHPSTEGKLVVGVRFPLHTTVKIAELLLQVSSLKNDARYGRANCPYFQHIACDRMLMSEIVLQDQREICETSILSLNMGMFSFVT